MGNKYKFVPKEGPAPGQYENSTDAIKPKIPVAMMFEEVSPERRPPEVTPDPGSYDNYYIFGSEVKPKIDMGNKYPWKPLTDGPGPGFYDVKDGYKVKGGYIEPEGDRIYSL